MRRVDLPTLRAAWWATRAARRARRQLRTGARLEELSLPPVPDLPDSAGRGVAAALRRGNYTCLVEASTRQAWHAAHGRPRDVVIGVTAPTSGFRAHAWLEGDAPCHSEEFEELSRHPAS